MSLGNRPRHSSFAVSRTLVGGNRDRGDPSWKHKDKKESPPVPDSTTEPAPRPAQKFQEGDEVFYQTDTGQQMLGTVGEVRGLTCLVQFGDGTEQLAPFKRLKKLFEDVKEEETKPKRKKSELTPPTQSRPQQTCGSCGVSRRISAKKAKLYEDELRQFECRRCVKQSQSPNSPGAAIGPLFNSASNSLKGKLPSDVSIIPMSIAAMGSQGPVFSLPSTSSPHALKSKSPSLNAPVSIPRQIQFSVLPGRKPSGCFNCENSVQPCDRVHCNMCERPCHLMCLSICPPPLSGDRFWDLLCSSCGNQNKDEIVKVFSVRRNINSWADIACLLISCLSVKFGLQRMFDFESEMLPFLETNMDRLHLPRMYKTPPAEARKKFILNALTTSRLRFQNGRELKKRTTLWGLRTDQYDSKKLVNSIAWDSGLKPTSRSEVPTSPPPLISPIGDGSISTLIPTVNLPVIIQKESPPLSYPENSPEVSDLVPLNSLKKSQSMFNIRENVSDTASDTDSSQASNTDRDAKLKKEPENKPIPTKGAKGLTSRNPSMIARVFQNWGGGGRKKSISESSVHGSRIAPLRLERRTFEERMLNWYKVNSGVELSPAENFRIRSNSRAYAFPFLDDGNQHGDKNFRNRNVNAKINRMQGVNGLKESELPAKNFRKRLNTGGSLSSRVSTSDFSSSCENLTMHLTPGDSSSLLSPEELCAKNFRKRANTGESNSNSSQFSSSELSGNENFRTRANTGDSKSSHFRPKEIITENFRKRANTGGSKLSSVTANTVEGKCGILRIRINAGGSSASLLSPDHNNNETSFRKRVNTWGANSSLVISANELTDKNFRKCANTAESKTSSLSPATLKMIKKDTLNKRKIAEVSNSQKTKQTSDESDRKRKIEEGSRSTQPNAKEPATKRLKSEILNNTSTKPVRRDCEESIQDVNKVTPPRKTFLPSPHSTSDESDDDLPLEVLKQNYDLLSPIQRAIKTASSIPPPAPQLKKNIESVSEIKPKLGRGRPKKENDSSSPIGNRLRAKKRGRPTTNSKSPIKSSINGATNPKSSAPKQVNVVNPKSGNTNANTVPIVSRRVGTFNSISERRPMPTVVPDPSLNPLNAISSALFDSAVYGNYRMECLPKSPQTDSERKNEALKVFSHFRTEKENEIAAFLLSRSLTETRSQTRRKSELFVGTQKRDLNDFDSYEVIGKRVDPDGITRYQVLWKRQDDPFSDYDDFEPEEEEFKQDKIEMESSLVKNGFRPFAPLQLLMGSSSENIGVKSVGNFPVMAGIDESSQFEPPEVLRSSSSSSSSLIDLTDSP